MGELDKRSLELLDRRITAAEKGRADALYDLGLFYSTGQGVPRDYVAAHKWFNLAAIQGIQRAAVDRQELANEMSPAEVAQAQRQAREWLASRR